MAKTKNRWAIFNKHYIKVMGNTAESRIPVRLAEHGLPLRAFPTRDEARKYKSELKTPTNYYVVDRDNLIAVR